MNKIVIIGFVVIVLSFTTGLASNGFNFAEAAGGWKPAVDALLAQITGLGDRTSDLEDEVFCSGNGTYDSETCTCDSGFSGNDCSETVPTPSQCGNGVIDSGESCDDGNTANGDGCSSTCLVEGNGDPIIQCSNGIDDDGDGLIDFPEDTGCTDQFDLSE